MKIEEKRSANAVLAPFARPLYVMLKSAGPRCNLDCAYCYYSDKAKLYDQGLPRMIDEGLLERFIKEYIQVQTTQEVLFVWHGGEPLLLPLSFYRRAVELQHRYARGHSIDNAIQTNGTLLTEEWCHFFRENHWLVGVSIDGPKTVHDAYRTTRRGKPSWDRVMAGIELLKRIGVEWNAMAVVNSLNVNDPVGFYHFFREIEARYLQFTPIVERNETVGTMTECSVTPDRWGAFLCRLFDEWVKRDVGEYYVQLFDATLANWCGVAPGVCSMGVDCGHAAVMEVNGDVYSCDHFVFPRYKLGNISRQSLVEMLYSERQMAFGQQKRKGLPSACRECRYLFACHGECPKNRFARTESGEAGLNYLCRGYYQFFSHVEPYMHFMRDEYLAGRPPANVMRAFL